ncbi:MAG: hypothetical protein R3C13_09225 [Hyphomonas sp.]|uniref:hypothetical protein n=1 Tax=Hyphomonas sp. TaxID=87 RepID=UPI0035273A7E
MKRGALILALACAGLLAACEALRDYHANNPVYGSSSPPYESIRFAGEVATPDERATCEAAGGQVRREGLLGFERCIQTYPDAGKTCSDSADCLGECRLPPDSGIPAGEPGTGTCQVTDSPFGCYALVKDGIVRPASCVD